MRKNIKICKRCILDETVPNIQFNKNGTCNYCELHDILDKAFPNNDNGKKLLEAMFFKIKENGKNNKYDCVVGISGGVDSTYLIHLAKEHGLRPLAVHIDNGWNSEISISNIKNTVEKLDVDLYTSVIDWKEMKDILRSFLKASYPWADGPTDMALVSLLYKVAKEKGIKKILVGNNFRTEGKQPTEWTYVDNRIVRNIHKTHGEITTLKSYPHFSIFDLVKYEIFAGIKMIKPLYFIDYDKEKTKKFITKEYGWKDYGGHHHESIFTRFIIGYWLPKKFDIDKRKITFSAQIRSGLRKRSQALNELGTLPYPKKQMDLDKKYIIKKLGFSDKEFREILESPNKSFRSFPSYYNLYRHFGKLKGFIFNIFEMKPMMAYDLPKYENMNNRT